jgi:ribulose-5-phosphate 4-epimerase/fuculose-1-phosphate aldolase
VTLRLPGGDGRFLMKPAGIGLEEMTPDGIITVDREGERIDGTMPRHNEVFIHSEILRVRSDIAAVVHTHPPHAVAFSSLGRPLLPVGNDGSIFNDGVPVFSETTDLIIDPARGKAVARCLGDRHALILRNHGIVTAGRVQLLAQAAGGPKLLADGDDLRQKSRRANRIDLHTNVFNYLVRRWKCRHCPQDEARGADPSGHSSRA